MQYAFTDKTLCRYVLYFPLLNVRSPMRNIRSPVQNIRSPMLNINSPEDKPLFCRHHFHLLSPMGGTRPAPAVCLKKIKRLMIKKIIIYLCKTRNK